MYHFLLIIAVFCTPSFVMAETSAYTKLTEAIDKHPQCGESKSGKSSKLSDVKGYYHGMLTAFARATCRNSSDVIKKKMLNGKNNRADALYLFEKDSAPTDDDKQLISMMTIALAHGLRESNGNFRQGYDANVKSPTASTAEAGLFQTSLSVKGADADMAQAIKELEAQYQVADKNKCLVDIFSQNIPLSAQSNRPSQGSGKGREFQDLLRGCPAFAAEQILITMRSNAPHYGPLKRKEFTPFTACEPLLKEIHSLAKTDESVCSDLKITTDPMTEKSNNNVK